MMTASVSKPCGFVLLRRPHGKEPRGGSNDLILAMAFPFGLSHLPGLTTHEALTVPTVHAECM